MDVVLEQLLVNNASGGLICKRETIIENGTHVFIIKARTKDGNYTTIFKTNDKIKQKRYLTIYKTLSMFGIFIERLKNIESLQKEVRVAYENAADFINSKSQCCYSNIECILNDYVLYVRVFKGRVLCLDFVRGHNNTIVGLCIYDEFEQQHIINQIPWNNKEIEKAYSVLSNLDCIVELQHNGILNLNKILANH